MRENPGAVPVGPSRSTDIGLFEIANVSLIKHSWPAESVFSKCLCVPRRDEFEDPLPPEIRKALSEKKDGMTKAFRAFQDHFGDILASWHAFSILLPIGPAFKYQK